jgi:hypothetical protein
MSSSLRVWCGGWFAVIACGLSSCIPEYRPPSLSEPHAVIKFRLAYHAWPRQQLEQAVLLGKYGIKDMPTPVQGGEGVVTRPILVRPGAAPWTVRTAFFHTYMTTKTESYTTSESYPCGKSVCSRSVPHTRVVNQTVRVNDAVCERAISHLAVQRGLYILQYDFFANQRCSLHCLRQIQQPDGTLGNVPCEVAPPPD